MRRVGVAQLKDGLSGILRSVEAGETVEVLDRSRPIARLAPVPDGRSIVVLAASRRPFSEIRDMTFTGLDVAVDVLELLAEDRAEPDWFGSR